MRSRWGSSTKFGDPNALEAEGREFESTNPDQKNGLNDKNFMPFIDSFKLGNLLARFGLWGRNGHILGRPGPGAMLKQRIIRLLPLDPPAENHEKRRIICRHWWI